MSEPYPSFFVPDRTRELDVGRSTFKVPAMTLHLKEWKGHPIRDTWGNKPVAEYEGRPMFAELVLRRMAVKSGWSAYWEEVYQAKPIAPLYFVDWKEDLMLDEQERVSLNSLRQRKLQASIADHNGNSYAGCWDVITWKGERTIYIEAKRIRHDQIRESQVRWLAAGLAAGLQPDNFLLVEWQFND